MCKIPWSALFEGFAVGLPSLSSKSLPGDAIQSRSEMSSTSLKVISRTNPSYLRPIISQSLQRICMILSITQGPQKLISIFSMGLAIVLGPRRCNTSCMGLAQVLGPRRYKVIPVLRPQMSSSMGLAIVLGPRRDSFSCMGLA